MRTAGRGSPGGGYAEWIKRTRTAISSPRKERHLNGCWNLAQIEISPQHWESTRGKRHFGSAVKIAGDDTLNGLPLEYSSSDNISHRRPAIQFIGHAGVESVASKKSPLTDPLADQS